MTVNNNLYPKQQPIDLWHLLQKRNTTFQMWAEGESVTSLQDFLNVKQRVETQGEFYVSQEMVSEAENAYKELSVEKVSSPSVVDTVVLTTTTTNKSTNVTVTNPNKKVKKQDSVSSPEVVLSDTGSESLDLQTATTVEETVSDPINTSITKENL
jgi:hypothetical protein